MSGERSITGLDGTLGLSRLPRVLTELATWGSSRDWIGADPYEGLNTAVSPLLRRSKPAMQAAIQLYRRSPFPPPWPLRAAAMPNAKVAGLVLSAYCLPAGAELEDAEGWRRRLCDRLIALRLPRYGAWGYHFDVQTRHLFYPATSANAISTCFAIRGLLDGFEGGVLPRGAEIAVEAKPFLASLWTQHPDYGPFFAYVPTGSELIHNANLMVAGTLARVLAHDPDPGLEQRIEAAVQTTAGMRRPDGLWPYGERDDLSWRDNFHTAYTIEGLTRVHQHSGGLESLVDDATRVWLKAFFDPSGVARYHPDRGHPIDAHSAASAIDALCVVAAVRTSHAAPMLARAARIAERAVDLLWLEREGRFANQLNARFTNRREFMRWTNAPMFEALARLLSLRRPRR